MANLTNFVLYLSKSVESFTPLPDLAEPSSVVVKLVGVWGGGGGRGVTQSRVITPTKS